jgi:hypothetical protein
MGRKMLMVFEYVGLRKGFGSERGDLKRDWRKFRDKELHDL